MRAISSTQYSRVRCSSRSSLVAGPEGSIGMAGWNHPNITSPAARYYSSDGPHRIAAFRTKTPAEDPGTSALESRIRLAPGSPELDRRRTGACQRPADSDPRSLGGPGARPGDPGRQTRPSGDAAISAAV